MEEDMSDDLTRALASSRKEIEMKCSVCRRHLARYRVRNAYQRSANGKVVCNSNVCWGQVTRGYPAEGVRIPDSSRRR